MFKYQVGDICVIKNAPEAWLWRFGVGKEGV